MNKHISKPTEIYCAQISLFLSQSGGLVLNLITIHGMIHLVHWYD